MVVFLAVSTFGWAGPKEDVVEGLAAGKKDKLDEAIHLFTRAIESGGLEKETIVSALNNRGVAYRRKGSFDSAIADYTRAIELAPDFAAAYSNRGLAYAKNDLYDLSIEDLTQAINIDPDNADSYLKRGNAYFDKGEYEQAIADFNSAIVLEPELALAYQNRSDAYREKQASVLGGTDPRFAICGKKSCVVPENWSPPRRDYTPTPSPEERKRQKEELERARQQAESRQRVETIENAIKEGDRFFSEWKFDAAIRAYQRVLDICDADQGFNMIFVDGTSSRRAYAEERIKWIEDDRRLDAEFAQMESAQIKSGIKINGMLDGLKRELGIRNTGSINFSRDAPSAGGLDFPETAGEEKKKTNALVLTKTSSIRPTSADKLSPPSFKAPAMRGLKIKDVPSPYGYTSKQEREAQIQMLTRLNNEMLEKRIKRTNLALERMKGDFLGVEATLNELVDEARDAEEEALIVSFKGLAATALKLQRMINADAKTLRRIRDLSAHGLRVLDYGGPVTKLIENPLDREANLEMARNLAGELHEIIAEHGEDYFNETVATELGTELTGFGGFIVDYTYEAARWAAAAKEIHSIIDNLDKEGGKLKAQLSLKRAHEDLIKEKLRRTGPAR